VVPWGVPVAGAVVVNATPIGMSGESLPDGIVDAAAGLVDLPYGPRGTPAITLATHLGLPFVDGIEFLVAQAGDAIRIWAGVEAPIPVMLRAARNV
jgi:shikimate dehydrogenase